MPLALRADVVGGVPGTRAARLDRPGPQDGRAAQTRSGGSLMSARYGLVRITGGEHLSLAWPPVQVLRRRRIWEVGETLDVDDDPDTDDFEVSPKFAAAVRDSANTRFVPS